MLRSVLKLVIPAILAGVIIDYVFLKLRLFEIKYDHFPGKCTLNTMQGAEDILLLPNNQAIITSGLHISSEDKRDLTNAGALYVLEMSDPHSNPKRLKFEGNYLTEHPNFNPHGISSWITENNDILLYVICHLDVSSGRDAVDVFQYYPGKGSVKFVRRIFDESAFNLNNLVMLGEDEFYITNWKYFNHHVMHALEQLLMLPLGKVHHVKDGKFQTVASSLRSANGINVSRNKKFIYVIHGLPGEILAYSRGADGSLTLADSIWIGGPMDNINVDSETGNLWVTVFIKPLEIMKYLEDQVSPVSAEALHVTVDEDSDKPFSSSEIESVYKSDGSNDVGGISVAAYSNGTLLLGSIHTNMLVCDVNYLHNL